jgi:hypothetical protein
VHPRPPCPPPTPSREDLEITRRLREVGEIVGVRVLDHVVIGHGRYVSFVDDGYWQGRVAVGTPVARRPPHRSGRAELPHPAPASGSDDMTHGGIGVTDPGPSALFGGFPGPMRVSDFPSPYVIGLRPRTSRCGLGCIAPPRRWRDLPVPVQGVSVHAQGLRPRRVRRLLAIAQPPVLPSALPLRRQHPRVIPNFRGSMAGLPGSFRTPSFSSRHQFLARLSPLQCL